MTDMPGAFGKQGALSSEFCQQLLDCVSVALSEGTVRPNEVVVDKEWGMYC